MPSKVVSRTCGRRSGSSRAAIAKLKEGLGSDEQALPADVASTLDRNLQILDQAIADSSAAVQKEPQNVAAREQPL